MAFLDMADGPEPTVAAVGQPVRDGQFQFTVTGSSCGRSAYGPAKALGTFCEIKLTVRNIGDKAQLFLESAQVGYDVADTEYSTDTAAALYAAGDDGAFWLRQINPGTQASGLIIFDVPTGTVLERVELHDSIFSGGAVVLL